jgi:hypothetical protein
MALLQIEADILKLLRLRACSTGEIQEAIPVVRPSLCEQSTDFYYLDVILQRMSGWSDVRRKHGRWSSREPSLRARILALLAHYPFDPMTVDEIAGDKTILDADFTYQEVRREVGLMVDVGLVCKNEHSRFRTADQVHDNLLMVGALDAECRDAPGRVA